MSLAVDPELLERGVSYTIQVLQKANDLANYLVYDIIIVEIIECAILTVFRNYRRVK